MSDLISRQAAVDAIGAKSDEIYKTKQAGATFPHYDLFQGMAYAADIVENMPSAQPEIIRCKDCKHRPKRLEEGGGEGFNLEFPDYKCPCQCDDGWYNWMPDDNWFCGNAERKEE